MRTGIIDSITDQVMYPVLARVAERHRRNGKVLGTAPQHAVSFITVDPSVTRSNTDIKANGSNQTFGPD
jgi:hypothetical protein